jgi:hypothetical protein
VSDQGYYALFTPERERITEWTAPDENGYLEFDITEKADDFEIGFSETGLDADVVFAEVQEEMTFSNN